MADFVAVIRRAVDGLSDNNPEMRLKVYEKARGAVRRQLEAMNPRPSDDLIRRQLDKLEAAIDNVEGEHAEALPAEEAAPEPVLDVTPEAEAPQPAEPETVAAEPEEQAVAEAPPPEEEEAVEPEPLEAAEPVEPETTDAEAGVQAADEPAPFEALDEPAPAEEAEPVEAHAEAAWEPAADEAAEEPADAAEPEPEPIGYVPSWHTEEPIEAVAGPEPVETVAEPEPEHPAAADRAAEEALAPETDSHLSWQEPAVAETPEREPSPLSPPPVQDLDWEWRDEPTEPAARRDMPAAGGEWGDLDALLDTPRKTAAADENADMAGAGMAAAATPLAGETAARPPQRSLRVEPKTSRLGAIVAAVAVLAVAGGAGAGYWLNRDKVDTWVGDLLASVTQSAPATTPSAETANVPAAETSTEKTVPSVTAEGEGRAEATTEVAAATGGQDAGGKFTQRLLADGSETDEGPAASLDATAAEGKSVAAQSEETAALTTEQSPAGTAGGTEVAQGTEATPGAAQTGVSGEAPAAEAGQGAIGVAQKMFLYEERLGQTSPTAIEGTVVWSAAEESPGGEAKPEPVVRAQLNVPSNGLTALITFRRNADRSLPASHIIEVVFSLPESFEGGGIESVQRVAMKRTEQDRGDQLIAVPAKITDDFHMIALNDFPEAIAKNTELLRSRNWIDIPVTYRNGRRALITLDKGSSGVEVFDTVMKGWTAQGTANSQ